jgi:uncharacterized membrane protein YbhN (UPF0104 family)
MRVVRAAVSLSLLALLVLWLDVGALLDQLRAVEARWLGAALVLAVAQVTISAWRWRYTAERLGLPLPPGVAVREYYLATFLNQVLPGGVLGDVSRAWRHAQAGAAARAVHAVIIERVSGQLVMLAIAVVSGLYLAIIVPEGPASRVALFVAGGGILVVVAVLGLARRRMLAVTNEPGASEPGVSESGVSEPSASEPAPRFVASLSHALLQRPALETQLAVSALIVATYLATGWVAGSALALGLPALQLLALTAVMLVAMLVPVTVAGWGLREALAAAVWGAVGRSAVEGVALSVTYGVFVLVGSLPGALVLLGRRHAERSKSNTTSSPSTT